MKKVTVTIGIPAYNEELNIENILRAIHRQKKENFILKSVLVNSDASSDKTNEIVAKLAKKYAVIKLINNTVRKGKYFRVNELFAKNRSDILVILDADIALSSIDFLDTLIASISSDKKALMVAAHAKLVRPEGFVSKLLHTSFILGDYMRLSVPGYDIAPNFHGAATAYRGSFVKTVSIPEDLSDPHLYIYLAAKKQIGFRFCPQAVILQNPPQTVADVKQLMQRSIGKNDKKLEKIFGAKMIQEVHVIPTRAKVLGLIKCFIAYPFYTPFAVGLIYYFGKIAKAEKTDSSPIWKINTSTKKIIKNEY